MANTATATRNSVKGTVNMGPGVNGKNRYVTRVVADATFDKYTDLWFGTVIVNGHTVEVSRRKRSRFWQVSM